jgi:hypothetical protein
MYVISGCESAVWSSDFAAGSFQPLKGLLDALVSLHLTQSSKRSLPVK